MAMRNFSQKIQRLKDWYFFHRKEVFFGAIIFLVSSLSFAAGYIANREFNHAPIIIEKCSTAN
jgi:hypothetical protein